MKICVAQTKPVPGSIKENIEHHIELIDLAIFNNTNLIMFPELSLSGYEPELAKSLAFKKDDSRLEVFQEMSDSGQITICPGAPVVHSSSINISMLIFLPKQTIQIYSKQYLHKDEEPWFAPGKNLNNLIGNTKMAPAICYEISIPDHVEIANKSGAQVYMASVAKSLKGVKDARKRLAQVALKYSMTVLMSNCLGPCENGEYECAGKSSIWGHTGKLLGQLDDRIPGLLILDTRTGEILAIPAK